MKWHREQYLSLMTFGQAPRPMFVELFGPLIGLDNEWRVQGASEEEIAMTAFDWDYVPVAPRFTNTSTVGGQAHIVVEETATHRIERDSLGRTLMLDKRTATVSLPMDFPVKNMDDWLKVKPMFQWRDDRIDHDRLAEAKKAQADGSMLVVNIPGAFDIARNLMGEENACMAYYDQPELMHDILTTLRETSLRTIGEALKYVTIDQLSVHEDLAGRSGPLIGPNQVAEFVEPYYRAVWNLVSSRGTRIFEMDTDGDYRPILDALLVCGLTAFHPNEPAAGVDMVELRRKYGNRVALRGGIDKFALAKGRDAIRAELEHKMQPLMREGGTVFGLDHRIPNGTPLEDYRYYVQLGREILGLPPRTPTQTGWARMAF